MPATSGEAPADLPPGVITGYTPPRVIYRPKIVYPNEPREAMVYVRLLISREGMPMQVEVEESRGFFNESFKAEALRYVEGLRFEPARLNGEAVEAGPLTQPLNFSFSGEVDPEDQYVNDEFKRELDKVGNFWRKRDYSGAHFHAEWMLKEKVQLKYEFAVLQAQLAQTHASVGNLEQALQAATQATIRSGTAMETPGFSLRQPIPKNDPKKYLLRKDLIEWLLELRMQLQAQKGEVVLALKTYNELAGLKKLKAKDKSSVLAAQLVALLESGRPLGVSGKVVNEFWSHYQYHPSFSLRNVKGRVDYFHSHCRNGFTEFAYVENDTRTLPADSEACVVEVYGEPGTTFDFIEIPASAAIPPGATTN